MNQNEDDQTIEDKYSIGFIDPQELIEFIPDEESDPDESRLDEIAESYYEQEEFISISRELEENAQDYVIKKKEDTRGRLAIIYTIATFFIFVLGFIVAIIDAVIRQTSIINNLQTILPLLSGIFLGTLGFVLGYYFKKSENDN